MLLVLEVGGEKFFALEGDFVLVANAVDDLGGLVLNFRVELLELVVELGDFGVRGTELRGGFGDLDAQVGLLAAQAVELGAALDIRAARSSRGRSRGIAGLHLAVGCFFLHAVAFRGGQFAIEFIQLAGNDVGLFVGAENFVFFLVADEFFLRGLDFDLEVDELLGEPVGGLHGGFELGFVVLFLVSDHQGVDDSGGEALVGTGVVNFDDAGVGDDDDVEAAAEAGQHGSDAVGIRGEGIHGDAAVSLGRGGHAAEIGTFVEIKLADDLEGEEVAFQNANFGVHVGGVEVVGGAATFLDGHGHGIDFVDGDFALRVVELGHAQAGNADQGGDDEEAGQDDPLAFVEDAEVVAQGGFVSGDGDGGEAAAGASRVGRETGANFAQDVAACRDYWS